ncbi:hypothetical protein Agub_g3701, partial [Astrephomene gubernaculifera]
MLSSFVAARQAALGSAVSSLASSAAWRNQASGIGLEVASCVRGDALFGQASSQQSPPPSAAANGAQHAGLVVAAEVDACTSCNGTEPCLGSASAAGSTPATLMRPQPWDRLMPSATTTSAAGGFRCLHSSAAASGAAATAASAARSAAAAAQGAAAAAAGGGRGRAGRQQPLSPHASEFQRRFFQLINSGADAATATGASAADTYTTSSQAVRMLLAWLEEGRTAFAEEQQQQLAAAIEGGTAAAAAAAAGANGVAAPYRLEQQVIDRAMEVLWRLYYREDLLVKRGGGHEGGSSGVEGPMGLRELMTAAEGLAAAAPAMGLTFKRQHYDLLLELYNKQSYVDPGLGRGLAQRLLAVRQQMVQQMLPVSQVSLNHILFAVRRDPEMTSAAKISTALKLIERDLPVVAAGGGSSPAPSDTLLRMLQTSLHALMRDAAKEGDWPAYHKFEAVLISRTRQLPPYDVLLEALTRAAAGGKRGLAAGLMAQMEQTDAFRQQQLQQQLLQLAPPATITAAASAEKPSPERRELEQTRKQVAWLRDEVRMQGRQEADSLKILMRLAVAEKDEQLANKVYDRIRDVLWRHLDATARFIAFSDAMSLGSSPSAASSSSATPATASSSSAEGAADPALGESAASSSSSSAAAATASGEEEAEAEEGGAPIGAVDPSLGLAAVAAARPAPADATLALLPLSLARRDWRRVVELVVGLAELQALYRRQASPSDLTWLVGGDSSAMERSSSAYGGLGPLSEVLMGSDADTVGYYSELLRCIAAAAAPGTAAAPFGGSALPFGPALRAAAARRDLSSVAEIVRQMRGLGCRPDADSYAAVIDASLRAGKPERVAGLLELMAEERMYPNAAVWEVQLAAAAEAGDSAGLTSVAQAALAEADKGRVSKRGVAAIRAEVLAAASAAAESRGDSRAAAALSLLRSRSRELADVEAREQQQRQQRRYMQQQQRQGG